MLIQKTKFKYGKWTKPLFTLCKVSVMWVISNCRRDLVSFRLGWFCGPLNDGAGLSGATCLHASPPRHKASRIGCHCYLHIRQICLTASFKKLCALWNHFRLVTEATLSSESTPCLSLPEVKHSANMNIYSVKLWLWQQEKEQNKFHSGRKEGRKE